MSGQTIDYDALAKQAGAVSSQPDYDALAKQAGAVSSSPATTSPTLMQRGMQALEPTPENGATMRFLKGVGRSTLGGVEGLVDAATREPDVTKGDIVGDYPSMLAKRLLYDPSAQAEQHVEDLANQHGTKGTAAYYGGKALAAVPIAGPWALQAGERAGKGDVAGAMGEATGMAAAPELTKAAVSGAGSAAGAVGDALSPIGDTMAQRSITKLIRPMAADLKFGRDPAGAIIREGITGNSLEDLAPKVYSKARAVGQQIDSVLQTPEAQTQTINVKDALSPIDERMQQAVKNGDKGVYDRLADLKRQLTNTWAEDGKGSIEPVGERNLQMNPQEATAFKRQIGDMTRWTGNDPFENDLNATKGEIFGKIKDQVNSAVPDVAELNSRYSDLVSAGKAIERRLPVAARNAEFTLGDMVMGGAGYHAAGPAGLAALAAKKILSTTAFKTRAAQALSSEADKFPAFEPQPKGVTDATNQTSASPENPSTSVPSGTANGRPNQGTEIHEPGEPKLPVASGARTNLTVPGENHVIPARYEVRELSDIHPNSDGEHTPEPEKDQPRKGDE